MKKTRFVEIGQGNNERVLATPQAASPQEAIRGALEALEDGEIFFPWGDGFSRKFGPGTNFYDKSNTHLSLMGVIKRLLINDEGRTILNPVLEHLDYVMDYVVPRRGGSRMFSDLTHDQVVALLRKALVTPLRRRLVFDRKTKVTQKKGVHFGGVPLGQYATPPLQTYTPGQGFSPPGLHFNDAEIETDFLP